MHSLMARQSGLYRLSRTVLPKPWRGEDLHLAMLSYLTTPLNHSLPSPAELLNSRKFRCLLPLQIRQQNHIWQYRNVMQCQKHEHAKHYNKSARDLPGLKTGNAVYVQLVSNVRKWIPGIVIERISARSYKVKTIQGGVYIRNRKFIRIRYTDLRQIHCPQWKSHRL